MKTKTHNSPGQATSRHQSTYFEYLKAALIKKCGEEKGMKLANRWWSIRGKAEEVYEEERFRIVNTLAS